MEVGAGEGCFRETVRKPKEGRARLWDRERRKSYIFPPSNREWQSLAAQWQPSERLTEPGCLIYCFINTANDSSWKELHVPWNLLQG